MSGKNLLEQRIISIDNIYFPVCGVEIETDIFLPRHLRNTELPEYFDFRIAIHLFHTFSTDFFVT